MRLVVLAPEWQDACQDMARDYALAGENRHALALHDFPAFLRKKSSDRAPHADSPGPVPGIHFWLADGERLLGRSTLRLVLTPELERKGGHIGYDVRPSARRRGIGTELLRLTLLEARARSVSRVLLTCDSDNLGSRAIIERNGGVFASESPADDSDKLVTRYWIQLRPSEHRREEHERCV